MAAALLHAPELHVVDMARHFDFLALCSDILVAAAPVICTSEPGLTEANFTAISTPRSWLSSSLR
jgi:hypothetical protein